MNRVARIVVLLSGCLVAAAANATVSLQFAKIGFTAADAGTNLFYKVGFNGVSEGAGGGARQFDNISGQVTYRLLSVTHGGSGSSITSTWRFISTITNTSLTSMSDARISAVGFSTAAGGATGDNPAFLTTSAGSITGTPGIYDILARNNSGLNLPNPAGSNNPQVCLKASGPANNCAGGGGDGLDVGTGLNLGSSSNPFPSTSAQFELTFTGTAQRTSITLHNLVLRFQSLSGTGQSGNFEGQLNGASGVGIVTSVADVVPEPSNWAMLIAGFGLIGATARRRRALLA